MRKSPQLWRFNWLEAGNRFDPEGQRSWGLKVLDLRADLTNESPRSKDVGLSLRR